MTQPPKPEIPAVEAPAVAAPPSRDPIMLALPIAAGLVCAAAAVALVVGVKVGKAVGAAQLGPVSKVIPVEMCRECAERHLASQVAAPPPPMPDPAEVEAMVKMQAEVEHATAE